MQAQGDAPLISVIIPTFNRASFISEAIDSVLQQSYQKIELLVVDDGSTDNTAEIMSRYTADPRVRFFQQPNQGQSVARNLALQYAKGEFICCLDSDNRWLPGKLEKSLAVFKQHPEVDIVYGDIVTIDENGDEITRQNMPRYSGRITKYLFRDNCVSINTSMVRRKCFDEMGGMEVGRRRADDYELWLRFSTRYQYFYLPEYLAEYRVMKDQISTDKNGRFQSNEEILRNFQKAFPTALTPDEFKEGWCRFYTRKGRYLASVGRLKDAFREYRRALRHKPTDKAPWRALARLAVLRS